MRTILEIMLIPVIIVITATVLIIGLIIASEDYYEKEYIAICEKDTSFNSIQECIKEYKAMNW